ncbi:hypothetical protein DITRI_Ditri03aG0180700 [Diplodiscus trichospermus]
MLQRKEVGIWQNTGNFWYPVILLRQTFGGGKFNIALRMMKDAHAHEQLRRAECKNREYCEDKTAIKDAMKSGKITMVSMWTVEDFKASISEDVGFSPISDISLKGGEKG